MEELLPTLSGRAPPRIRLRHLHAERFNLSHGRPACPMGPARAVRRAASRRAGRP